MNAKDYKISVLMPNYNHGSMVGKAIQAIIDQTYENWDLIIVDDGSLDGSQEIIAGFAGGEPRIKATYFPENKGVLAALEFGVTHLSGEFYYGAGADDFLMDPTFFERAVSALKEAPGAAGAFGRTKIIDFDDGRELGTMGHAPITGWNQKADIGRCFFSGELFVPGTSAIWNVSLLRQLGFFQPDLGPQADYYFNHALPALGEGVVFIDALVAAMRASSKTFSGAAKFEDTVVRHALVESRLRQLPVFDEVDPALRAQWRFALINSKLNVVGQRSFFRALKDLTTASQPWQRNGLSEEMLTLLDAAELQCRSLESEMERRVAAALATFDTIAPESVAVAVETEPNTTIQSFKSNEATGGRGIIHRVSAALRRRPSRIDTGE